MCGFGSRDCGCCSFRGCGRDWGCGWGCGWSSHCSGSWRRRRRGWAGSRGWAAFGQWASPLQPVERGSTWPPGWPQATQQAGPGDAPRLHEAGRVPATLADRRIAAGAAPGAGSIGVRVPRAAFAVLVPAQRFLGRRGRAGAAGPPLRRARAGFGGRTAGAPGARVGAGTARGALPLRAAVPAVRTWGRGGAGRPRARGPLLGPFTVPAVASLRAGLGAGRPAAAAAARVAAE